MRRRQLKWLWKRLRQIAAMELTREELLMKLGAARAKAPAAWRLVDIDVDKRARQLHLRAQSRASCARSGAAKAAICCAPI